MVAHLNIRMVVKVLAETLIVCKLHQTHLHKMKNH